MRRLHASSSRGASIRPCGRWWPHSRSASSLPVAAASPRRPRSAPGRSVLGVHTWPVRRARAGVGALHSRRLRMVRSGQPPRVFRQSRPGLQRARRAPRRRALVHLGSEYDRFAYVDRNALSLPAELTADDPNPGPPSRSVVVCLDRSTGYRYTGAARSAIARWIRLRAPGRRVLPALDRGQLVSPGGRNRARRTRARRTDARELSAPTPRASSTRSTSPRSPTPPPRRAPSASSNPASRPCVSR